jgi:hypothetical protein
MMFPYIKYNLTHGVFCAHGLELIGLGCTSKQTKIFEFEYIMEEIWVFGSVFEVGIGVGYSTSKRLSFLIGAKRFGFLMP